MTQPKISLEKKKNLNKLKLKTRAPWLYCTNLSSFQCAHFELVQEDSRWKKRMPAGFTKLLFSLTLRRYRLPRLSFAPLFFLLLAPFRVVEMPNVTPILPRTNLSRSVRFRFVRIFVLHHGFRECTGTVPIEWSLPLWKREVDCRWCG